MKDDLINYTKYWDNFNIKLYKLYKRNTMKCFKITYRERDHAKVWRKMHSLRYAHTKEEAIKQLDRSQDLIIKVEFLGYKKNT